MRFIPGIRYIDPSALGWDALPAGAAPVRSDAAWNLRLAFDLSGESEPEKKGLFAGQAGLEPASSNSSDTCLLKPDYCPIVRRTPRRGPSVRAVKRC